MRLRFFGLLSLSLLTVGLTGLVSPLAPVVHADEGETQAGYNDITNKGGPWVHIYNRYSHSACSGTLLTPQKVITARHCSAAPPDGSVWMTVSSNLPPSPGCFGQVTVIINGVKQPQKDPCLTKSEVVAVHQHPSEDIAILTLKHVLPGTYPAKLAQYDANLLSRQTRAGWHIPVRVFGSRSAGSPNDLKGMFYGDGAMRSFGCGSKCSREARYYRGLTRRTTDVSINHDPIYTNVAFWHGDSGGGIFRNEELIGVGTHGYNTAMGPAITDAVRAWMNQVGVFNPMQYTYPDGMNNGGAAPTPAPNPAPSPAKPSPTSPWGSKPLPKVSALSFPYRKQVLVSRIAGSNRVETSLALFDRVADKSVAVLATGRDFPDGLVGGNLAGALKSGVILTMGEALEPEILEALRDNGTKTVYLVGGESAISDYKETRLQGMGIKTIRLAGEDRFKTAEKIKEEVRLVLEVGWGVLIVPRFRLRGLIIRMPWLLLLWRVGWVAL